MPNILQPPQVANLAERIKEARDKGALFHPTNPADSYYCTECDVFGKAGEACWCCDSILIQWQYVPRWGGGAQTVVWEDQPKQPVSSYFYLPTDTPDQAVDFDVEGVTRWF